MTKILDCIEIALFSGSATFLVVLEVATDFTSWWVLGVSLFCAAAAVGAIASARGTCNTWLIATTGAVGGSIVAALDVAFLALLAVVTCGVATVWFGESIRKG